MKKLALVIVMLLGMALPVYAIDISINSSINVTNAPANSRWAVECGPSTGVYTSFTRQFTMASGTNSVPVSSIFLSGGNYFCRTNFIQVYGVGPYSSEVAISVLVPSLSAPALTVIP